MASNKTENGDARVVDYKQMNIPDDLSDSERQMYEDNQTVQLKDKNTGETVEVSRTEESPELGKLLMVCGIIGAVLVAGFLIFSLVS
ncbi:hypothetical protein Dthio_PD1201 [Desulfonatronospira thiodismutans ASO3-1]|uniref:Uncharacterized protein n=1 Tax=Desulfonatronospira thiodismutans ASO3-1 TaxID=555779 RepID=D6ST46_9BACT|nr:MULTISPECIES: hypothetical protein [Desulfonatronospira]EFI33862.1 hypothetical protein Dthio_PD1201 [Desulfonatronospira thiodismutans ASO3-1]RQD78599.1 MAG: hypothetical protein D5S03_02045 [Desulfonatronospira sp. MSAO_Bac3]